MRRLKDKSALITGAARGIGRAFAGAFVREGAQVAFADIDFSRAQKTASEIGSNATAVALDATSQVSIDQALTDTLKARGKIDILVNNATLFTASPIPQSAALDLIKHNINAISSGVVDGEHWDGVDASFAKHQNKAPGQKKKEVSDAVPYGRMGTADDLTGMAVFLARKEADYIVGQTYNVDGGQWMS